MAVERPEQPVEAHGDLRSYAGMGKDKVRPEDVLEMNDLLRKIGEIDLGQVAVEKEARKTDLERMLDELATNRKVRRIIKGKSSKPLSWQAKRKRRREWARNVGYPRKKAKLAIELTTPEGWWKFLVHYWRRKKITLALKEEEFYEHIYPLIEKGNVPIFQRYENKGKISLDNLIVRNTRGEVLWEGAEWKLRKLGYVL